MKKMKKYSKGFTLVELLVVIAIIGILAAVVLVSLASQRNKANLSSAVQSMKSAIPYAMDCRMRNVAVTAPSGTGGGALCDSVTWPSLGTTGCTYGSASANNSANVTCGTLTATCTYDTGACI